MKNVPYISNAVMRRLPRYYRYLGELVTKNVERISSAELSEMMSLTASQVRQDLNHFGDFGQQGYGYNVKALRDAMGHILGVDAEHQLVIIGAGHLGTALAGYTNYQKRGFKLAGIFDINPDVIGTDVASHTVMDMEELESFLKNNPVDIAVLALPKAAAHDVAQRLIECGIKYFWNFVSVDFNIKEKDVIVENVHLSDSLMTLSYRIAQNKHKNK